MSNPNNDELEMEDAGSAQAKPEGQAAPAEAAPAGEAPAGGDGADEWEAMLAKGEDAEVFASANMAHPRALADAGQAGEVHAFARNQLCALARPNVEVTAETLLQVPEESFSRMLARANSKARIRGIVEGLFIGLSTGAASSLAVWYVTK